jgi:hypothetical protein
MTRKFVAVSSRNLSSLVLALVLLSLVCADGVLAQKAADIVGDWSGALSPGNAQLHVVVHVRADAAGKLNVTLDSVDQNAMGLAGADADFNNDRLSFKIPSVSGGYSGKLSADGKTLSGTWTQGLPIPLVLTRSGASSAHAVTGDWSGVLDTSKAALHLVLHVTADSADKLKVTLDSPDQHAFGLPGSNAALQGETFTFEVPSVSGTYSGTLSADGKTITGTWTQKASLPLVFTRK